MKDGSFSKLVFLTPTDTTIGFVSQNAEKLDRIKKRPSGKHYIKALPSLSALKRFTRVPDAHKNRVRRSMRSTFIFPNGYSYRIIKDTKHLSLIKKLGWAYTTSANISGFEYDSKFAENSADVIVVFPKKRNSNKASNIFKLNNIKIKRLR